MTGRGVVVFDIDGVLADASHRQHFVAQRPKDWDSFFAAVGDDPVIEQGRARLLAMGIDHEVVLVSGRPESTRAATVAWLERHGMGRPALVLRAEHDYRPAAIAKADLLAGLMGESGIICVIDDDEVVVQALSQLGYPAELFDPSKG